VNEKAEFHADQNGHARYRSNRYGARNHQSRPGVSASVAVATTNTIKCEGITLLHTYYECDQRPP
jgi:hypothetical protein